MGFIIFAVLFGLATAGSVVQLAVLRRRSFRITDHYEIHSEFMAIVVIGPATVGALIGAVGGGVIARYLSLDRS